MRWQIAWSDKKPEIIEQLVKAGLADAYLDRPHLPEHLSFYMNAFWELSRDRVDGGVIPFLVIDRYATRIGITDEDTETFSRFRELIARLDRVYLDISEETAKQKAEMSAHSRATHATRGQPL